MIKCLWLALILIVGASVPARADATVFIGANTTPSNRMTRGAAIGTGLVIIGFEFEYSKTDEDLASAAPSLTVGSANGVLQTPLPIMGFQPYVTAGGGIYHEQLGLIEETSFTPNFGGGVKVSLAGPIRLRVDYRVFKLSSGVLYSPSNRFYVGLNLKF